MTAPLVSTSIAAPGFFGLNTQESSITLESGFALVADNTVIDKYGRLGARKGWSTRATPPVTVIDYSEQSPWALTLTETQIESITRTDDLSADTRTYTVTFKAPHGYTVDSEVYVVGLEATLPPAFPNFGVTFTFQYPYIVNISNGEFVSYSVTPVAFDVVDTLTLEYTITSAGVASDSEVIATDDITFAIYTVQVDVILQGAHRFVGIDGVERILSWSEDAFFIGIGGTLTRIVPTTDNVITTGNWQAATLNDFGYFFQRGYKPMVYDPIAGTITDVEDEATYSGAVPQANTVLSAYGRLWVADTANDKMVVYWSDLLDGASWGSGSAGSIDLTAVMVQGTDEIVGLGAQNGQLLIFCRRAIVIFADSTNNGTLDPATLSLVEVINRVGCVARDSIQNTGVDIFFLSEDGLKSLGRVIQEKSLPMRDLSANIRDDLVKAVSAETKADIKSVYSEDNAFYLLLLPSYQRIYCFDTRAPLPNGALRATIWDTQVHTNLLSLPNAVYFTNSTGLAEYTGYQDNSQSYRVKYYTNYFDFGTPTQTKILKRLSVTVIGGSAQDFVLKSGFDYTDAYQSYPATLTSKSSAEYGTAEYNVSEYASGTLSEPIRLSAGGSGNVLQMGFEATVNGAELSIQKMDIFIKQGRIY
jgi:hypothetical protein